MSFRCLPKLLIIIYSLKLSIPDVPQSNRSKRGCFTSALAKASRCFYPPDKLLPFSITDPSKPPLLSTNYRAFVICRHSLSLSSEVSQCWLPYLRLSLKVPLNRYTSWVTYETILCISLKVSSETSTPSIMIFPSYASSNLVSMLKRVDFPEPLGPTNATIEPGLMFKLKLSQMARTLMPYQLIQEKQRFSIWILTPSLMTSYLSFQSYLIFYSQSVRQ